MVVVGLYIYPCNLRRLRGLYLQQPKELVDRWNQSLDVVWLRRRRRRTLSHKAGGSVLGEDSTPRLARV